MKKVIIVSLFIFPTIVLAGGYGGNFSAPKKTYKPAIQSSITRQYTSSSTRTSDLGQWLRRRANSRIVNRTESSTSIAQQKARAAQSKLLRYRYMR